MKVLQVINELKRGGGAEKLLVDLVVGLKKELIDVSVLSIKKPSKVDSDFLLYLKSEGVKVYFLSNKIYSLSNLFYLFTFFCKNKYDIVHVHLFPALYYCGILGYNCSKLVYTEHSTSNRRRGNRLFKLLDKLIYSRYNHIVSISDAVYESLSLHIGCFPKEIVANGVDFKLYNNSVSIDLNRALNIPDDSIILMMVARFIIGKDYITLFNSLSHLSSMYHIICVGHGPLFYSHQEYCKDKQWGDRVHFLGLRNDVERLLKAADIIVLSSEHEGFSIAMLEAMSSGKPFIASAVPGIYDILHDVTMLFPYGNSKYLAEIIRELIENHDKYVEIAKSCENFAKQYDIKETVNKYMEIYKKL